MTEKLRQPVGGLYRPQFERDNCGFGLIAHMDNQPSHWLVKTAISALMRLTHRGAIAADGKTGDGCGLLLKKPDAFLRKCAKETGIQLSAVYAVGMVFLNPDQALAEKSKAALSAQLIEAGVNIAGWRTVPTDASACGEEALKTMPHIEQVFVNAVDGMSEAEFNRKLFVARRLAEKQLKDSDNYFYVPSLCAQLISYKGLVMPANLPVFYRDLQDESLASSLCVFHQRSRERQPVE